MFVVPKGKGSKLVNIGLPIYDTLAATHGPDHAKTIVPCLRLLHHLRLPIHDPPLTETTKSQLLSYYRALNFYLEDCQLPYQLSPEKKTSILWMNSFNEEDFTNLYDLRLDKLAVLYNLGVNESVLAMDLYQHRNSEEDVLRRCAKMFQYAAGFFQYASKLPSPGSVSNLTSDLRPYSLKVLSDIMVANAQISFMEACEENNTSPAVLARFAAGISDLLKSAADSIKNIHDQTSLQQQGQQEQNKNIFVILGIPCRAVSSYYKCISLSYSAQGFEDQSNDTYAIVRLREAKDTIQAALLAVGDIPENLQSLESIRPLKGELNDKLKTLNKDVIKRLKSSEEQNKLHFFEQIPDKLQEDVIPHQSTKVSPVTDILMTGNLDPKFEKLRSLKPLDSEDLSNTGNNELEVKFLRYADSFINDISNHLNISLSNVKHVLQADYPKVLKATTDAVSYQKNQDLQQNFQRMSLSQDEQRAVNSIEQLKQSGGTASLKKLQNETNGQANLARTNLANVESMLKEEEQEDARFRQNFPGRRATSMSLTNDFRGRLGKIQSNLEYASNADNLLGHDIETNLAAMDKVMDVDIESAVKIRLSRPNSGVNAANNTNIDSLRNTMDNDIPTRLSEFEKRKDQSVLSLQRKRQQEDEIAAESFAMRKNDYHSEKEQLEGMLAKIFANEKNEALNVKQSLDDLKVEIEQILGQFRTVTESVSEEIKRVDQGEKGMLDVFKHEAAAKKYNEIVQHLQQGRSYYIKESENINRLVGEVNSFVISRKEEINRLVSDNSSNNMNRRKPYYPGAH